MAEIAEARLCAQARAEVQGLLDKDETLADAAVWPDRIRDDSRWQRTRAWHYINVPDGGSPSLAARRGSDNLLAALARQEAVLADRRAPRERRAEALRFVVHLVADLHQPLHVGRAEDRGGNRIRLRDGQRETNLHQFWDGQWLFGAEDLGVRDYVRSLQGLILAGAGTGRAGSTHPWLAGEPVDWAGEAMLLRDEVYRLARRRSEPWPVSRTYRAGARNVLNLRLAQAGVRLAGRLNRLGCEAAAPGR